jgi:four helix bundle protein
LLRGDPIASARTVLIPRIMSTAKSVEELEVYQKALKAAEDVSELLKRPSFQRDLRFREQMGSSSERVVSAISEGFEQSTDRHFAQYCYRSRGSSRELRTQLVLAVKRAHITEGERVSLTERYAEIARMLTGLIRHLEEEDRRNRR